MSRQNMSNFEADSAADHEQHIFDMTGIHPDPRIRIPTEEVEQMIYGVKAGDEESAVQLIATRLNWIYYTYAQKNSIRERLDLREEDIMQIGSLATLETAREIDTDDPTPNRTLHARTPHVMGGLVMKAKLLPTISPNGFKLTDARYGEHDERMAESLVPVGNMADVAIAAQGTTVNNGTPEKAVIALETPEVIDGAMDVLDEVERYIVEGRHGIGNFSGEKPMAFTDIARDLGLNRELVRRMHLAALEKLAPAYEELTTVPQPRWTKEQLDLQQKWFREIERKQETGEIAFVRGRFLDRPLPHPVSWYLMTGEFHGEYDGAGLKAAIHAAAIEEKFRATRLTSSAA